MFFACKNRITPRTSQSAGFDICAFIVTTRCTHNVKNFAAPTAPDNYLHSTEHTTWLIWYNETTARVVCANVLYFPNNPLINEGNCQVFPCNAVYYAPSMCRSKHSKSSEFCQVAYRMSDITQAQPLCLWKPVTFACSLFARTDVRILDSIWRNKGKHECLDKKNLWACRPRHFFFVSCPVLATYRMDYFLLDLEAAAARSAAASRSNCFLTFSKQLY